MATRFRLSPKARADYVAIYAYTVANFGEDQAERYTSRLLDAFEIITRHNSVGRDIGHIRKGYFRLEHEGHTIYYSIDAQGVVIVRILGARQAPLRHL